MTVKAKLGSPVFYNSIGPNPRLVKVFMKEKGIKIPFVDVDLLAGENRQQPYLAKNSAGQMPCLEIDDGVFIAEILPICEYLNDIFPEGIDLFGKTPEERAITRMWLRRIDYKLDNSIVNGFRFAEGYELFKNRLRVMPQAADDLKKLGQEMTLWFDEQMADGRKYIAGDRLTLADFWAYIIFDFGAGFGQKVNPEAKRILEWMDRMKKEHHSLTEIQ
ncbi:glutathione S-transferase domain-containing protein [Gonapodya prolifera JEL478]|uniref:Glutathione S-transferase domain-containing protein n=1 Tax=Gonapodya prolifera (strain JEL478) TaxID=1344416 RepID=A0A139A9F2_GONPJ|nr:glutathione S-transferase domain-containing protein [Gonapodya prolifera JEL478]|eukprot:KXS13452.1 glutathione S-transferase domain-containing protein [Gonapodya prolifera JEL478]